MKRMEYTHRWIPVALLTALAVSSVEAAQRQPHTGLKQFGAFTDDELQDMEQGKVVSKVLETDNKNEVAVIGAVWIEAPAEELVARQRDIENFETGDAVLAIQKISSPPRLTDFSKLTLPQEDLDDFAECRVGDCPVKADDNVIERLHAEVDWKAPDAHQQANRVLRQLALEGMQEYIEGGNASLSVYRDKKRPLYIQREFEDLLDNSPYVLFYDRKLHDYLREFPGSTPEGVEEYLYWSKVKFGLKPVVRISHVVIYPIDEARRAQEKRGAQYVIASKMLYASHYFHTGLELKYLTIDTAKPDAKGFYFISINRSRSDGLTGLFGGIVRSRAQAGARDGLAGALENAKKLLESESRRASQ